MLLRAVAVAIGVAWVATYYVVGRAEPEYVQVFDVAFELQQRNPSPKRLNPLFRKGCSMP